MTWANTSKPQTAARPHRPDFTGLASGASARHDTDSYLTPQIGRVKARASISEVSRSCTSRLLAVVLCPHACENARAGGGDIGRSDSITRRLIARRQGWAARGQGGAIRATRSKVGQRETKVRQRKTRIFVCVYARIGGGRAARAGGSAQSTWHRCRAAHATCRRHRCSHPGYQRRSYPPRWPSPGCAS
jgi:hypothetical protein